MDANGDGTIDLEEWTTCMTPELRRGIYKSLSNPDKLKGFQPLVDVAKVNYYFWELWNGYNNSKSLCFQILNLLSTNIKFKEDLEWTK